jgi:hypothetical protein
VVKCAGLAIQCLAAHRPPERVQQVKGWVLIQGPW